MSESCGEISALVRNIVDTVRVSGRGCQADVQIANNCEVMPVCLDGCASHGRCGCCEFISASAGPLVTLVDAVIEPSRTRAGSCLYASLIVPVSVIVRIDGVNRNCHGSIHIPVEGTTRGGSSAGPYQELVAQANVRVARGCYIDGCVRLWVDFQAEVHAICLRAVRIPILGSCDAASCESCPPYFNLPLYPMG